MRLVRHHRTHNDISLFGTKRAKYNYFIIKMSFNILLLFQCYEIVYILQNSYNDIMTNYL